jgi:hypothetical protein
VKVRIHVDELTQKVSRFPFFLDEYDSYDGACWEKAQGKEK